MSLNDVKVYMMKTIMNHKLQLVFIVIDAVNFHLDDIVKETTKFIPKQFGWIMKSNVTAVPETLKS